MIAAVNMLNINLLIVVSVQISCITSVIVSTPAFIYKPNRDIFIEFYPLRHLSNLQRTHFVNDNVVLPETIHSIFDGKKETFLYVHGFYSKPHVQIDHARAFVENIGADKDKYNFILLNWTNGSLNLAYPLIRRRTRKVSCKWCADVIFDVRYIVVATCVFASQTMREHAAKMCYFYFQMKYCITTAAPILQIYNVNNIFSRSRRYDYLLIYIYVDTFSWNTILIKDAVCFKRNVSGEK